MRRLWPRGVAGRVALILAAALIATQSLALLFIDRDRAEITFQLLTESLGERIAAIVALMNAAPAAQREALIPALNSPTLWVALDAGAPRADESMRVIDDDIIDAVRDHLPDLGRRSVDMWFVDHWRESDELYGAIGFHPAPDLLPSRRKIVMSVGLDDGAWLVFVASSQRTSWRWARGMLFWLGASIGVVVLFSVWAARRVTAPLSRFAAAADRLGVDVAAPPLPETGSAELRRATRAFNRMQDRLRRLVEDRTRMLAAISHDLRTMLTRLRLRAEYIEDGEQRAKAFGDLDDMGAMLAATLSFARDDIADERREKVDLASLTQSLCDDLADAGEPVRYHGPDRLTLACRPRALRRALANLIDNAVKYGGEAEVGLASDGDGAAIAIADRGPGVPANDREAAFAPFTRLERSRSRETGGAGLGLAVARAVARAHGGEVTLAERDGGGLVARLTLPGTETEPAAAADQKRRSAR